MDNVAESNSLADELQCIIDNRLAEMRAAGIQWSAERQAEYNAASIRFYQASMAKDSKEMEAAIAIVRRVEAEGGLL